jgi:predicted CXXCH cytochrome family protein
MRRAAPFQETGMRNASKWAVASAIALTCGAAWGQAITGKEVLNLNTNRWLPGGPYSSAEFSASSGTFHAGGVAACDGCHVMHNASGGRARSTRASPWTDAVPAFLLQGSDQSSTCLNCHGDAAAATATTPYVVTNTSGSAANMNFSPAGDFGWLAGAAAYGDRSGHNVVALDFGLQADALMTSAPGGTFTPGSGVAAFACSSCHDPHGRFRMQGAGATWAWAGPTPQPGLVDAITQPIWSSGSYGNLPSATAAVGSYRLLAGVGYAPASNIANPTPFVANPPIAVAPPAYNHAEGRAPATQVRVAYGAGMSEWCANCHSNIHMSSYVSGAQGGTGLKHPAGRGALLKPGQYNVYNTYVSSGVYNGTGDQYTSLVPFENASKITYDNHGGNTADITALAGAVAGTDTAGIFVASAQSNVMCLSCHRAHASGFSSMLRWNGDDTFITDSAQFADSSTPQRGQVALQRAYYGRTAADLGAYQRSLCNKCHAKD